MKQKKQVNNLQEIGFFFLIFGYALAWSIYIISDYYSSIEIVPQFLFWKDVSMRTIILNIGYFPIMIGAFLFIFFMEKYRIYFVRKYFFTILFSILIIIHMIVFFINLNWTQPVTIPFWPLFILFFIFYVIDLYRKVHGKETISMGLFRLISGFFLLFTGYLFTTDLAVSLMGQGLRMVGAIFQLISIFLLSYFFMNLPPFSEFDWQDEIEDIYLITKGGMCLYHNQHEDILDTQHLLTSGLAAVKIFLETAIGMEGISVIKKEGKLITIYPSTNLTGVVISNEELNNIKIALKKFILKTETIYHDILISEIRDDVEIFRPISEIARSIFYK